MFFSDPFITSLKKEGYNVVRLPKASIKPLQLLYRYKENLERLGELHNVLVNDGGTPLPTLNENSPAANIDKLETAEIKIGLGLSILGWIIGAMGGSKLGIEAKYKNAKSLSFKYENILEDSIQLADLDKYLANSDLHYSSSGYIDQLLDADQVYITTATIKSDTFTVDAGSSSGTEVELSVPEIQGIVGANVGVSADAQKKSTLIYKGHIPLVFGFQALQLFYDRGEYTRTKPVDADLALKGLEDITDAIWLKTDSSFTHLDGY